MNAQRSALLGSDGFIVSFVSGKAHVICQNAFVLFPAENMDDFETLMYYIKHSEHNPMIDEWAAQLQAQWDDINRSVPTKEK